MYGISCDLKDNFANLVVSYVDTETLDKKVSTVSDLMITSWIQYFGSPLVMIADQGNEFLGIEFQAMCERQGILLYIPDVRAPWQNGRTERHGDLVKKLVAKACFHHTS